MSASDTADLVADYVRLVRRSPVVQRVAASFLSTDLPARDPDRPLALVFAPHPDDECLTGLLPLRLRQEANWNVLCVAITLGSNADRRAARQAELANACTILGFKAVLASPSGFTGVSQVTRQEDAPTWQTMVSRLSDVIATVQPNAVFFPHPQDAHTAHIGTYLLGRDALAQQPNDFTTFVFHTEYWHPIEGPNLMIGGKDQDVTTLLSALTCHIGENNRNGFDTRFPAYLIDNVRRGSERVGGQGANGPEIDFAMLYKFGLWRQGKFMPSALRRIIHCDQPIASLFD